MQSSSVCTYYVPGTVLDTGIEWQKGQTECLPQRADTPRTHMTCSSGAWRGGVGGPTSPKARRGACNRNLSQWKFRAGTDKGRPSGRGQHLCLLGPLKASASPSFFLSFAAILGHPESLLPFHFSLTSALAHFLPCSC